CIAIMPFANAAGVITIFLQCFTEQGIIAASISTAVPQKASRVHHGTARHANRALPRALVKTMGKRGASLEEAIKIWRKNLGIVQGVDGPEALVISDQDEEIWFSSRLRRAACD